MDPNVYQGVIKCQEPLKPWALVTGAGGFIGHHLVSYLKAAGYRVRGVDIKRPEYGGHRSRRIHAARPSRAQALRDVHRRGCPRVSSCGRHGGDRLYHRVHAGIAHNNSLINLFMLEAARNSGNVERFLFLVIRLRLSARPADLSRRNTACARKTHSRRNPKKATASKLYAEKLCQYYTEDYGLPTRIVRFHNVYGPLGTYDGGREKAPAAMCRKIARAPRSRADRGLGRRQADPLVHVYRRLRGGHSSHHEVRITECLSTSEPTNW